jgi:phage/plasmid primase-like uncharacterized protein
MTARHFRRGRSTYPCMICGRLTRDTDQCGTDLCQQCYDICGLDNTVNDNGYTGDELRDCVKRCDELLAEIAAKGGDVARVKRAATFIWPQGEST